MSDFDGGFKPKGELTVFACRIEPANMPGVISFPEGLGGNGLGVKDGQVVDLEIMDWTQRELDEARYELEDGESVEAWGRFD